jgi:hypothetical protein
MEEAKQRMRLSNQQRSAVIHLDDNGVADPAALFVMDFPTWQKLKPINFFNYFAPIDTVASYSRFKPVWQRYELLQPIESKVLQGIYDTLNGDSARILGSETLSRRFYNAYVEMSGLVDELDALVDRDLRSYGQWNHGYVLNDKIIAD